MFSESGGKHLLISRNTYGASSSTSRPIKKSWSATRPQAHCPKCETFAAGAFLCRVYAAVWEMINRRPMWSKWHTYSETDMHTSICVLRFAIALRRTISLYITSVIWAMRFVLISAPFCDPSLAGFVFVFCGVLRHRSILETIIWYTITQIGYSPLLATSIKTPHYFQCSPSGNLVDARALV